MKIKVKNFIRLVVGILTLLKRNTNDQEFRIYFNLIGGKVAGGPDRFLKSITTSKTLENKVNISNWSLKGCKSALVFSSSWGKSFSLLCKYLKVKSVLRVDGFYVPEDKIDEEFQQSRKFRTWLNGRLKYDLESFDHIIYQSKFSKEICDKHLYRRDQNFSIIHNGTNINFFSPNYNNTRKSTRIVILGKHYPKHLNLAIEIFSEVIKTIDAELVIIGPMRNGVDGVQNYINSLNLQNDILNKVKCLGICSYEELPELLSSSDLLLHVKIGDWCPNAVLEAMASGLPVVCPSWGGTKELVGEAGIIVNGPEWDVNNDLIEGMVDGVLDVSRELDFYKKLARKRVEKEFNIENISKQYLDVLKFYD
jgi:glycosyltransferase involved in cell wall biosynthesis